MIVCNYIKKILPYARVYYCESEAKIIIVETVIAEKQKEKIKNKDFGIKIDFFFQNTVPPKNFVEICT